MKKLHKLILQTYLGPFVVTFFVMLFILIMQFLWLYIDDLVGKGLETLVILELLFYASARLVYYALPIAILLSSLMTFGRFGEHYELVALKSSGLSLFRILYPATMFIVVLSIAAFFFSDIVIPKANLKAKVLLNDITSKKPALDIQDGIYYKNLDGFVMRVDKRDKETDVLYDVLIYDHTAKEGNTKVIRADSGTMKPTANMKYLELHLYNGYSYDEKREGKAPLVRNEFSEEIIRIQLSGFKLERSDEERYRDSYQVMDSRELLTQKDTLFMKLDKTIADFHARLNQDVRFLKDTINLQTDVSDSIVNLMAQPTNPFNTDSLDKEAKLHATLRAITKLRSSKVYLGNMERRISYKRETIARFDVEFHKKLNLSFACLMMFFIGAPLGAIIRKGGLGMPTVISVILFVLYYILSMAGEKLLKQLVVGPEIGMWLPAFVMTPMAVFISYKASTDSVLLDGEFYTRMFERLGRVTGLTWLIKKLKRKKP